nr:hypothetical protein CFP56_16898 [Quercus suber]
MLPLLIRSISNHAHHLHCPDRLAHSSRVISPWCSDARACSSRDAQSLDGFQHLGPRSNALPWLFVYIPNSLDDGAARPRKGNWRHDDGDVPKKARSNVLYCSDAQRDHVTIQYLSTSTPSSQPCL